MKKKKLGLDLLIPFIVAGVFSLANLLGFYRGAESRIYDLAPAPEARRAREPRPAVPGHRRHGDRQGGHLPLEPGPHGRRPDRDGGVRRRLRGVRHRVRGPQPPGGRRPAPGAGESPSCSAGSSQTIQQNIRDLFQALRQGNIGLGEARDYIRQLEELTDSSRQLLLAKVAEIARDNDTYLGRAARLFGKAFFTVNMVPEAGAQRQRGAAALRAGQHGPSQGAGRRGLSLRVGGHPPGHPADHAGGPGGRLPQRDHRRGRGAAAHRPGPGLRGALLRPAGLRGAAGLAGQARGERGGAAHRAVKEPRSPARGAATWSSPWPRTGAS